MKKNRMMRLASILLVCVLLSTSVISGTFAKYVSEATGTDSARVAKWDIKLEGAAIAETFSFDLFATINDTGNTADETDVADALIAPGTAGSFVINLKNDSEVTAEYAIDYTVTNTANIPVEFCVDGTNWTKELADVAASESTKLAMNATEDTTVTVQWRWVFENGTGDTLKTNDAADTALGLAGTAELKVDAKITVQQVD